MKMKWVWNWNRDGMKWDEMQWNKSQLITEDANLI